MIDAERLKHLELLQTVITRMAQNSFQLKAWGVVLVSGLLALGSKEMERSIIYVAYVPLVLFAVLDAGYLALEKNFRALYDLVRNGDPRVHLLDMQLPEGETRSHVFDALGSWSVWAFWLAVAVAVAIASKILLG